MAMFFQGDKVEVCSKEEGFLGSYYQAKILSPLNDNTLYRVQYKNLVEEEDQTRPLVEIVSADEVFHYLDSVDAFDNDGWWVGKITGRQGSKYWVYFETTRDEIAYPVSRLRHHLEWRDGHWILANDTFF
ncbi:hypothetical protein PVK06_046320 [Gossypium arboreum]|uniref:Agenet domain-containing protein n=1 Tax=Gossypium arboreum TaxID=29729 RepID=A0ABR0MAA5_GOSAR|nr:hypothetical protein PVK06_046320 [Gossypium arboreum]